MAQKKTFTPTQSELEILHILWSEGPSSVRKVNDLLNLEREVGYTTTLKLMQIMLEKRLVTRDASSRSHIYQAKILEAQTQKDILKSLVDKVFGGSAKNLVMQALGNHKATKEELAEIKKLIEQIENKKS